MPVSMLVSGYYYTYLGPTSSNPRLLQGSNRPSYVRVRGSGEEVAEKRFNPIGIPDPGPS